MQGGVPEGLESSDLHFSFRSWEGAEGLILTLLQSTGPPLLVRGAGGWVPCSGILAVSTWKWREGAEGPRPGWEPQESGSWALGGPEGAGHRVGAVSGSF